MRYFFIIGLPRTRTVWLANWFSYGDSFCLHEALKRCKSVDDLKSEFEMVETYSPRVLNQIGDSDSIIVAAWPSVMKAFPEARWLHVKRRWDHSARSHLSYFKDEKFYLDIKFDDEMVIDSYKRLSMMERAFESEVKKQGWNGSKYLSVYFDDLEREETAKKVWSFIMPDEPWWNDRWKQLESFRMNIIPDKVGPIPLLEGVKWQ